MSCTFIKRLSLYYIHLIFNDLVFSFTYGCLTLLATDDQKHQN